MARGAFLQVQVTEEKRKRAAWWPSWFSVIAAVHCSLTVGYAYGHTSTALEQLSELPDGYAFHLGSISAELFAILVPGGAFVCCLLSGAVTDRIGRKKAMLLTGIPNAVGWILIAISPYIKDGGPSVFKVTILTGRFLIGAACSGIYASVPLYSVEVALTKQRGAIATLHLSFIIIGVSIAYGVGAVSAVSYSQSAIIGTGFVFAYVILVSILPESPRWLVIKGHDAHAIKVLTFLRRSRELATKEVGEIKKIADHTPNFTFKEQLNEIRKQHVYTPLAINLCLIVVQNICGQYVLEFFSSIILEEAGVSNPAATAAYSVGAAQAFGTIVAIILIDRVGRKPLLFLGGLGTGVAATLLGTHFYVTQTSQCNNVNTTISAENTTNETGEHTTEPCNPQLAPLAICSLVLFSLGYSISYRSVYTAMKAELFPLSLRGISLGLIDCLGWLLIATSVGSYNQYEQAAGPYTAWWSFAAVSFGGALFVLACVPETKGKSLEDIELMFRSKKACCITSRKLMKAIKKKEMNEKSTPV